MITSANLCEAFFAIEENFAKVHYRLARLPITYLLILTLNTCWMHYTFVREEASHEISKNLYHMKISYFTTSYIAS